MPPTTSDQSDRRAAILELLSSAPVANQQALVQALRSRGLKVTQSSVSRDLRDLGAVKTPEGYSMPRFDRDAEQELAAVAPLVRSTSAAGAHLLVIKTATGAAQRVALALDRSGWPEIVGNIGGDDTVFVATTSSSGQKLLKSKIERARAS